MTFKEQFPYLFDRRLLIKWIKGKVAEGHIDDVADTMLQQIHKQRVREAIKNYVDNGGYPSFAKEILEGLGL